MDPAEIHPEVGKPQHLVDIFWRDKWNIGHVCAINNLILTKISVSVGKYRHACDVNKFGAI